MKFLKDHYEKLILGLVLIGLAFGAWKVSSITVDEMQDGGVVYEAKAEPYNTETNESALARFTNIATLDFEDAHQLFNPNVWQRKPDGSFVTGNKLGAKGVTITDIKPLVFSVTFVDVGSGATPRCSMRINRVNPPDAKGGVPTAMTSTLMAVGDSNEFFTLKEINPPEAPTEAVLEMKGEEQPITIAKGKSYERIEGYIAELRYDVENKTFRNVREKSALVLSGETNNVMGLNAQEVILVNPATSLKTTLKKQ